MNALKKFAELFVELQRRAEYERKRRELGYDEENNWQEQAFAGDDSRTPSNQRSAPVYYSADDTVPDLDDLVLGDDDQGHRPMAYQHETAPTEIDAYALDARYQRRHAGDPARTSIKGALHSRGSLRQAIVLKELLDRPLAMRTKRGLFRYR